MSERSRVAKLGLKLPLRRPVWQRRRTFGDPVGVRKVANVPIARRRRKWVSRDIAHFEQLEPVGEGTYGQVWSARDKVTNEIVALKRLRMDNEREGFPLTAIREIKLLKTLNHDNIVKLKEIISGRGELSRADRNKGDHVERNEGPFGNIYMVFEFIDHDLVKLLDERQVRFDVSQVKNMAMQLLSGLAFCHKRHVLHRDIKGSNVLLDRYGRLKLADFGLARLFGEPGRKYTNRVVTLWYRAPELLLGATRYGAAVDMWSVGCLIAELLIGKPLFAGRCEIEQTTRIFKIIGSPTDENWPNWKELPHAEMVRLPSHGSQLQQHLARFDGVTDACVDLLTFLLCLDPEKRPSAEEAMSHEWFMEAPLPCQNHALIYAPNAPKTKP